MNSMIKDVGTWQSELTLEEELARTWHKDMIWCCLLYTSDAADDMQCVDLGGRRIIKKKKKKKKKYYFFFFFFPSTPFALFFFFFSSRRRHTRFALVSWARRCV